MVIVITCPLLSLDFKLASCCETMVRYASVTFWSQPSMGWNIVVSNRTESLLLLLLLLLQATCLPFQTGSRVAHKVAVVVEIRFQFQFQHHIWALVARKAANEIGLLLGHDVGENWISKALSALVSLTHTQTQVHLMISFAIKRAKADSERARLSDQWSCCCLLNIIGM